MHYRNKETQTCGYADIYRSGAFGEWTARGESAANSVEGAPGRDRRRKTPPQATGDVKMSRPTGSPADTPLRGKASPASSLLHAQTVSDTSTLNSRHTE